MVWMLAADAQENIDEAINKAMKNKKIGLVELRKQSPMDTVINTFVIITTIIGIGSGFWFTATSILAMQIGAMIFLNLLRKRIDERLKNGEQGGEPVIAHNPLL